MIFLFLSAFALSGRADIFRIFLFLSASALLVGQTFPCFSCFCLPLHHWSSRHFPVFPVFVCLCIADRADIFLVFLVLSASASLVGQTFSGFSCFCLPLLCCSGRHFSCFPCFVCLCITEPGRHFSCFPCFVCLCITGRANIFRIFLFLSADS